jgi:H+/Cl- antiporter ClcA
VQIGASIMFALGRLAPHRQRGFMLAGSPAGVAAAFNTPLAGIVFGIEEMSRSFEERTSTIIIGTVIAAGLTSLALVGNYEYFGSTPATFVAFAALSGLGVAICGLATASSAPATSRPKASFTAAAQFHGSSCR